MSPGQIHQPSVSVVIAAYNAEKWICDALDSILAQTFPVLEVWVEDDGSTDGTSELVKSYKLPVHCELQPHRGQPAARNAGIRRSVGELIAFIDADDYWSPRKLETQINLIRSRQLAWVICDAERFDNNNERIHIWTPPIQEGNVLEKLILGNFIISPTPVVRREVFDQVGYFNESPEARIGEDWDMWLRIAARYPLGVVREKLAFMRSHAASMIASTSIHERVKGLIGVIERAVNREPERLLPLRSRALGNIYYGAAVQLMKQSHYEKARSYFLAELKLQPLDIRSWIYLVLSILGGRVATPIIAFKRRVVRTGKNGRDRK